MKITGQQVIRFSLLLFLISVITFIYWILYKRPVAGIDDSDIYFTYVKNFVNGYGFVYYPGGERVEGFTSLLWVLLTSMFYVIDVEQYPRYILAFNVVIVTIALFMCCNFIRRLTKNYAFITPGEILFLAALILIPGYIDWTILTLMETGLWSVLLIVITLKLCTYDPTSTKDSVFLSILLALLVTVRPESLLWCFVFVFLIVAKAFLHFGTAGQALKRGILPLGMVILTIAALTFFRMEYFGYPLPNTYYAKVSGDKLYNIIQGIRYYLFSMIQSPVLLLVTLAALVSWIFSVSTLYAYVKTKLAFTEATWIQFVLSSIALVSLAIPVYIGGDHFKLLRFYQPFFPVLLLLFFNTSFWERFVKINLNFRPIYGYLATILFIPFIYFWTDTPLHTYVQNVSPIDWEFRLSELGRSDATRMNRMFSRLDSMPSVGVSTAGGFGYAYNGVVLDLMGLNNVKMAHATEIKVGMKNHAAFDKKTFYELQPDIFHGYWRISSFVPGLDNNTLPQTAPDFLESFPSDLYKDIFADDQFTKMYKPVLIEDPQTKLILQTYVKTTFIPELKDNGYNVVERYWLNSKKQYEEVMLTESH
jgi:hypothetical protein